MTKVLSAVVLSAIALTALGCEEKKADAPKTSQMSAAAPAKTATPAPAKPASTGGGW